ncbi:hypothetical protein BKA80DRAFT_285535 [Phyllosticta citrichinensis]
MGLAQGKGQIVRGVTAAQAARRRWSAWVSFSLSKTCIPDTSKQQWRMIDWYIDQVPQHQASKSPDRWGTPSASKHIVSFSNRGGLTKPRNDHSATHTYTHDMSLAPLGKNNLFLLLVGRFSHCFSCSVQCRSWSKRNPISGRRRTSAPFLRSEQSEPVALASYRAFSLAFSPSFSFSSVNGGREMNQTAILGLADG